MANALIKKKQAVGGIDKNKIYIDEQAAKFKNNLSNKEDAIQIVTEDEYFALSQEEKKDKTFLVTHGSVVDGMDYAWTSKIKDDDNCFPLSSAVYELAKGKGIVFKVVDELPSKNIADRNTVYCVKDENSESYIEYYLYNEQWIAIGIGKDLSLYATTDDVPFSFGINSDGKNGYYKKDGTFVAFPVNASDYANYKLIDLGSSAKSQIEQSGRINLKSYGITDYSGSFVFALVPHEKFKLINTVGTSLYVVQNTSTTATYVLSLYVPQLSSISSDGIATFNSTNNLDGASLNAPRLVSSATSSLATNTVARNSKYLSYKVYYKQNAR